MARSITMCLCIAGLPWAAAGQAVRGVVVDRAGLPVAGVVVQLLDTASAVAARTLTDERGAYRVNATRPGDYRLRTLRIGFRPATSAVLRLGAASEVEQRLELTGVALALDTVRVGGRSACGRAAGDSAAVTFAAFEQVRTALTAAQITLGQRAIAATVVTWNRVLAPAGRPILRQSSSVRADSVVQPWASQPVERLRRVGYVETDVEGSVTYHAPGLDVLLSAGFVEDHCFRLASKRDTTLLGIAFEPLPDRRLPGIRGTIWVHRPTSELRSLEYRYVNIAPEQEDEARGEMEFARMRNGAWAISRWNIRMPVLEQRRPSSRTRLGGPATSVHVAEIRVAGGELALATSLASRGRDTLWARAPLTISGTVSDSASGAALGGARIELTGTSLNAVADGQGRFAIRGALPGEYTLEVRTASLDSVGVVNQRSLTLADEDLSLRVRVPSARQVAAALCGAASRSAQGDAGIVVGTVTVIGDSIPPANARVVAEWSEAKAHGYRWLEARTDARGRFRVCGLPVNTPLVLRASAGTGSAEPVLAEAAAGSRFAQAELVVDPAVPPTATFTGVVVSDTTLEPIAGAEVLLPGLSKGLLTNERGEFRLREIPPGTHPVNVRKLGWSPMNASLEFGPSATVERKVVLRRVATLDEVRVTAPAPWLREFEDNRRFGIGHFYTREFLETQGARQLSDVLVTTPGLKIIRSPPGGRAANFAFVAGRRCQDYTGNSCPPCPSEVYLDNQLISRWELFNINTLNTFQIEAIEFYADRTQAPPKYNGPKSACGVLVIHTRK